MTFTEVMEQGLSKDWITGDAATEWNAYLVNLQDILRYPPTRIYGGGATIFSRINHIATHNLFASVFDQFLKALARIVADSGQALDASLKNWDGHEPHYALYLAFLRLFEQARAATNTFTGRHLDFYYRDVLRLKENLRARPCAPAVRIGQGDSIASAEGRHIAPCRKRQARHRCVLRQ